MLNSQKYKKKLLENILSSSYKKYISHELGFYITILHEDIPSFVNAQFSIVLTYLEQVVMLIASLIFMLFLDYKLTLFSLLMVPISMGILFFIQNALYKKNKKFMKDYSAMQNMEQEVVRGKETIYVQKSENFFSNLYEDYIKRYIHSNLALNKYSILGFNVFLTLENFIHHDFQLMRFIEIKDEGKTFSYEDAHNLNIMAPLEVRFYNDKFFFNTIIIKKKKMFPAITVFDKEFNKLYDIVLSELKIKIQKDLFKNLGWFVFKGNALYYVSLGTGKIYKIDLNKRKIVLSNYHKERVKKINYKTKSVTIVSAQKINNKLVLFYLDKSKDKFGFKYEVFRINDLKFLKSGVFKVSKEYPFAETGDGILLFDTKNKQILFYKTEDIIKQ